MYAVTWDPETNGILLKPSGEGIPPKIRPVFYEELDLLGFDKFWDYDKCEEPLLWRLNRSYYYRGERVAKATGGNLFEKPRIEVFRKLRLEPVDVEAVVRKNEEALRSIVNQTIDFIRQTRKKYEDFKAFVGFSGGKDSTIILDLVRRALPSDDFVVVFNDTSMELSGTISYVQETIREYSDLKFVVTKHEVPAIEYWKLFGVPSRVHRWCCTVHKMLPTIKFFKENFENGKILFYDGIRAEESAKRTKMDKITFGKNFRQINIHPILDWTSSIAWLYVFERNLKINPLYRYGFNRLGCIVCPFESEWWESILGTRFFDEAKPYIDIIEEYAKRRGVEDVEEFIKEGNWKARVGGKGWCDSKVTVRDSVIVAETSLSKFLEWLKVLGSVKVDGNRITVFLNSSDVVLEFNESDKLSIRTNCESKTLNAVKTIAFKSAYCVACGTCEVSCPSNAISKKDSFVFINENCSHCLKCLKVADRGCLRAESLKIPIEVRGVGLEKVGNYKHFGLRKNWLEEFFSDPEKWWKENKLGPAQFESMRRWLIDAEIVEKTKEGMKLTDLGKKLAKIGAESLFTWAVIWTNLARNSNLIRWYVTELEWGKTYTREELIQLMGESLSKKTRENAVQSLSEIFRYSPLGYELGLGVPIFKSGKKITGGEKVQVYAIEKKGAERVAEEILEAILYSLYRLKDVKGEHFSVTYLERDAKEGPMKLFGIGRKKMENVLRLLNEKYRAWISVDIVADLDNVSVKNEKSAVDVIDLVCSEK